MASLSSPAFAPGVSWLPRLRTIVADNVVNLVAFSVAHYGMLAVLLLLCYLWGGIVTACLPNEQKDGRLFVNTAIGLGMLVVFLFYAALASLLYPAVIVAFLMAAPAYHLFYKRDCALVALPAHPRLAQVAGAVILASMLLALLLAPSLYPPQKWDAISYHLPYARLYAENHGLTVNTFLRYPLYAHNYDLLYSLALLFSDDILAQLLHATAALLTAAGMYLVGKETHSRTAGILAAVFFLTSPTVLDMMAAAYIDLGLTLFVFLAFFCLMRRSLHNDDRWLYLSGAAAGLAMGSKYSGILYMALFFLWVAIETKNVKAVGRFLLPALLIGSPWYIRNFVISGDPFSPFGGEFFGYWVWDRFDLVDQNQDLMVRHGTSRTFTSLLKLPANISLHPELFLGDSFSPGILALYPGLLLFWWLPRLYRKITVFVLVNILLWFFGTQIVRYLLPALPMILLLSAVTILHLYRLLVEKPVIALCGSSVAAKYAGMVTATIPVACAAVLMLLVDASIINTLRQTPIPTTENMRNNYLSQRIPAYDLLQIANRWPDLTIYQLGFENSFYFARGKLIGDWFGPARYRTVVQSLDDPQKLHASLKALKAQLFLYNKVKKFTFTYGNDYFPFLDVVAETPDGILFRVK